MAPSKTRHLDTAVDILSNSNPTVKRAKRKADVELVAQMVSDISFVITANGRIVDTGEGDMLYARQLMHDRAQVLKRLGKSVTVQEVS
jgi:hypothetical protein